MNTIESTQSVSHTPKWLGKLGLVLWVALLWAGLHYLTQLAGLSRGMNRPTCALLAGGGLFPALIILVIAGLGAVLWKFCCRRPCFGAGMLAVGLALAIWAYSGGTMDDWLIWINPSAGPPSGKAYVPLLLEYAFWLVLIVAVFWLTEQNELTARRTSKQIITGLSALGATVAIAAALLMILSGPRIGHTYHGQVYFSVAVSFLLSVIVARRLTDNPEMIWFIPAPLIVGVLGVLLAIVRPGLGETYANINVIPAWALVRPLPIEMVSVGLVAILLTLRTANRISSEEDRG